MFDPKFDERFWSKVDKRSPGECWHWQGVFNVPGGYGQFRAGGKIYSASRSSWSLANGREEMPRHLMACHHCDHPACVNPSHIFAGTATENVQDCIKKGRRGKPSRWLFGAAHPSAKLTEADVIEIRSLKGIVGPSELGRRYGVSSANIHSVLANKSWRSVGHVE